MEDLIWLDACARRLTELEGDMSVASADRIATRISHTKVPVCYRHEHPVLAAESWYAGATSSPQASYAAVLACEVDAAVPTAPGTAPDQTILDVDASLHAARTAWAVALRAAQQGSDRVEGGESCDPARLAELTDAADAARRRYARSRRASIALAGADHAPQLEALMHRHR
jgi:hypothetical protein